MSKPLFGALKPHKGQLYLNLLVGHRFHLLHRQLIQNPLPKPRFNTKTPRKTICEKEGDDDADVGFARIIML